MFENEAVQADSSRMATVRLLDYFRFHPETRTDLPQEVMTVEQLRPERVQRRRARWEVAF
jgi:hypothetical protein